jgi:streptogramin lyase
LFGRIKPDGTVDEFDPPTGVTDMGDITAGPDGNLWTTTTGGIVKIPPSDPTTATKFDDANIKCCNNAITVGSDGNLWTGSAGLVIEIPPSNPGGGDTPHSGILAGTDPRGIAAGSDGNLWIIDDNADDSAIVRFDTAGNVVGTPVKPGGNLQQTQIAAGPAGQLAFTQPVNTPQRIGRIDFTGHIDFTDMPGGVGDPTGIVFGNDGAYWSANFGVDALRRLTPSGDLTTPINFDAGSGPRHLTKGPNDTLWVGLEQGKKIAKITGVSAPPGGGGGGGGGTPPPDKTKPVVSSLKLSAHTFRLGSQLATFSRKRTPIGTTISFKLSEASTMKFSFAYSKKGYKSGKRCLAHKPRGKKKKLKRCTRVAGTLSHKFAAAGSHRLEFEGRFSRHKKLKPGRYRLSVVATDPSGNKSKAKTASLKVLKK